MMETKKIKIARTNKGIPVMWENIKKFPTMKLISCVFDNDGNSIDPIFNRFSSNASLVPIREDYYMLKLFFDTNGCGITLLKLLKIDTYSNNCDAIVVARKNAGSVEWIMNESDGVEYIDKEVFNKIETVAKNIQETNHLN